VQVNDQLNALIEQQDGFIRYYTAVTVETINNRIYNVNQFTSFLAKFQFMNTLFTGWAVAESNPRLACTEITVELNDSSLRSLRDKSASHNSPVLNDKTVSSYFTSNDVELSDNDKESISKHIGINSNALNFGIQQSAVIGNDNQLEIISIMMLSNINDPKDFKGMYYLFPGSCGDIDTFKTVISRLIFYY
jgi:hypothetical protein